MVEQLIRTNERLERLEAEIRHANGLPDSDPAAKKSDSRPSNSASAAKKTEDTANQVSALFRRGDVLYQAGKPDEAVKLWQQVLLLQPRNTYALTNIGIVYTEQANWSEAQDIFTQVVLLEPDNLEAHYGLGLVHASHHDYASAAASWEYVLRLQPDNEGARANLAVIRERMGLEGSGVDALPLGSSQASAARQPAASHHSSIARQARDPYESPPALQSPAAHQAAGQQQPSSPPPPAHLSPAARQAPAHQSALAQPSPAAHPAPAAQQPPAGFGAPAGEHAADRGAPLHGSSGPASASDLRGDLRQAAMNSAPRMEHPADTAARDGGPAASVSTSQMAAAMAVQEQDARSNGPSRPMAGRLRSMGLLPVGVAAMAVVALISWFVVPRLNAPRPLAGSGPSTTTASVAALPSTDIPKTVNPLASKTAPSNANRTTEASAPGVPPTVSKSAPDPNAARKTLVRPRAPQIMGRRSAPRTRVGRRQVQLIRSPRRFSQRTQITSKQPASAGFNRDIDKLLSQSR